MPPGRVGFHMFACTSAVPQAAAVFTALLLKAPGVERPTLTRALVHEWLPDALQAFVVAAKVGSEVALWMPSEDPCRSTLKLSGVELPRRAAGTKMNAKVFYDLPYVK